ncbi:DUF3592 domain-containing protein [uncultured Cocleimonas sp.]|uniref:DUF3592 domain-containing protein n=1 Tax=uncultured Cocleimonas sp. TaxID=1051587 RepID=UPI002602F580|nr:DUF3592 domain-containing protein [uncultured Cocleimonas sp.]
MKMLKYIFLPIGLALLAGAFYFYTSTQTFLKGALSAQGTVIELVRSKSSNSSSSSSSYTYKPVVEFKTPAGKRIEFTSSTGSKPPSYSKGEIVEVFYDESFPQKAKINGFFYLWGPAIILGLMGVIFTLIGAAMLFMKYRKNKNIEYLKLKGTPVKAKFQSVERNRMLAVNKSNPYQIYAQWKNPMTSELHIFKSENLWFDPTNHINTDEITVLIDRNNPKIYYVDTSFLPKLAD